jgi:hypothetical protein
MNVGGLELVQLAYEARGNPYYAWYAIHHCIKAVAKWSEEKSQLKMREITCPTPRPTGKRRYHWVSVMTILVFAQQPYNREKSWRLSPKTFC